VSSLRIRQLSSNPASPPEGRIHGHLAGRPDCCAHLASSCDLALRRVWRTLLNSGCGITRAAVPVMSIAKALLFTLLIVVVAGCGGSPTEPSDYYFGRMDVYVRDTTSQPINGVPVRLERTNGQVVEDGAVTGNAGTPGYTLFLRTAGDYRITITVPSGYVLADGQSATVPVTFRKDQTDTINFVLRRL
jgi:hypothetical protein